MYSQTRKLLKGGGIPRCQCSNNCTAPPFGKSPFCRKHAKKGTCRIVSPLSGWEPHYMPTLYNGAKKIRTNHNCFAYAFDIMDPPTDCKDGQECRLPFHQPGYSAGYPKFSDSGKKYCGDLLARLFGDMPWLRRTTFEKRCRPGHSKIALVIDPDNDYHFYRQDSNGLWSHKPGGMPVTNRDASGKLIYNPALCDRDYRKPGVKDKDQLNYSVFCSFLCVPRTRPVTAKRGGGFTSRQLSSFRQVKRGGGRTTMTKKTTQKKVPQSFFKKQVHGLFPGNSFRAKNARRQIYITGILPEPVIKNPSAKAAYYAMKTEAHKLYPTDNPQDKANRHKYYIQTLAALKAQKEAAAAPNAIGLESMQNLIDALEVMTNDKADMPAPVASSLKTNTFNMKNLMRILEEHEAK